MGESPGELRVSPGNRNNERPTLQYRMMDCFFSAGSFAFPVKCPP